jgi:hypothetical protein
MKVKKRERGQRCATRREIPVAVNLCFFHDFGSIPASASLDRPVAPTTNLLRSSAFHQPWLRFLIVSHRVVFSHGHFRIPDAHSAPTADHEREPGRFHLTSRFAVSPFRRFAASATFRFSHLA